MTNPLIEKAMNVIDDFETMERPSPWTQIRDRKKVAAQLRDRVNDPFLIDQGTSGTCVPAAVTFEIARADPNAYVVAVTQLYNLGSTFIRKWMIKPCTDSLKAPCPAKIAEADWIILASIRDSENFFFDVESDRDEYASGSNLGEVADWFERAGYTDIKKNRILVNVKSNTRPNLKEALELYNKDYNVIIRICAACLQSSVPSWSDIKGNHEVALAGTFTLPASDSERISIPIFTWGKKTTIPMQGGLTYGQFLDQYYGYVAGKY